MTTPSGVTSAMRWASACSTAEDAGLAAREAAEALRAELGAGPVDLAIAFFSAPHVHSTPALAEALRRGLDRKSTRLNSSHSRASRMPSSA